MQSIPPFDLLSLKENLFWNQTSLSTPQRPLIIYDYNVLCLQTKFESRLVFSVFIFFQNMFQCESKKCYRKRTVCVWTILNTTIWFTFVFKPEILQKIKTKKAFPYVVFAQHERALIDWNGNNNPERKSSKSSLVWYEDLKPLAWIIKENFSVDRRI